MADVAAREVTFDTKNHQMTRVSVPSTVTSSMDRSGRQSSQARHSSQFGADALGSLPEETSAAPSRGSVVMTGVEPPKYRLGSVAIYDNPCKVGEYAWKNRRPIVPNRNWGSLFQENTSNIFGGDVDGGKLTAESMVQSSPVVISGNEGGKGTIKPIARGGAPTVSLRPPPELIPKTSLGSRSDKEKSTSAGRPTEKSSSSGEKSAGTKSRSYGHSVVSRSSWGATPTDYMWRGHNQLFFQNVAAINAYGPYPGYQPAYVEQGYPEYVDQGYDAEHYYMPEMYMQGYGQEAWQGEYEDYGNDWETYGTQDNAKTGYAKQTRGHGHRQQHKPPVTVESYTIPTLLDDKIHGGQPLPIYLAQDTSPKTDDDDSPTHQSISSTWTIILVDKNLFTHSLSLKEDVQKRLTSVRVKAFKSAAKCWRSFEKKTRLEKTLFVCNAEEAPTLATCLRTKKPTPLLIVYDGEPELPIEFMHSGTRDLVENIASVTGCIARQRTSNQGVNFRILWVDEQAFKVQGQARKQELELLEGCVDVKTYKSADKCIRAAAKKHHLDNIVILIGAGEADELIAYLMSRQLQAPFVIEATGGAKWQLKSNYDSSLVLKTSSWEETASRLCEFASHTLSKLEKKGQN